MNKHLPTYIKHGVITLLILLIGISVARMHVRIHQTEELLQQLDAENKALSDEVIRLRQDIDQLHENNFAKEKQPHGAYRHYTTTSRRYTSASDVAQSKIVATELPQQHSSNPEVTASTATYSQPASETRKFTEPHKFNINLIDSATLVRIPGIGAKTANTILRQRQRYGGFYSPWQLQDFLTWDAAQAYMEEWCTRWFEANAQEVHHLAVNRCTVSDLVRHPYISYDQAVKVLQYRTRNKRINKMEELESSSIFTASETERLAAYLSFE